MDVTPTHDSSRRWAPPPWGESSLSLSLVHVFGGGAILWVVAFAALTAMWTEYDGLLTLIGLLVAPLIVAIPSATGALILGLPVRLVPSVRRWWWTHGGYTLLGAALGLVILSVGVGLVRTSAESGESELAGWQILGVGWGLFCVFTMHFVLPRRWRGRTGPITPR